MNFIDKSTMMSTKDDINGKILRKIHSQVGRLVVRRCVFSLLFNADVIFGADVITGADIIDLLIPYMMT